jgi:S-adenosyl-L-methionine hydrolase (adenosine-forming)
VYARQKPKVRLIANEGYFRDPVSATFHGRDIFAPVAAHLAAGVAPARMGKLIGDYLQPDFLKPQRSGERSWTGRILKIDRFGNIVTNFHIPLSTQAVSPDFAVTIGRRKISSLVRTYAEARPGELVLIVGSSGYLEVSLNQGSAVSQISCKPGAPAKLTIT